MNPKTAAPWPEVAQIYSSSVLPKSMRDASIDRIESRFESENGELRQLGCLAYQPGDLDWAFRPVCLAGRLLQRAR
jgi:hypothetical protein